MTRDGISGMGIVQFGSEVLGISLAADQMASGIFQNGGIPSGVIQVKGKMNDDAYLRLKKSWDEQNGGRKSGGTSILEEGAEYKALNIPPEALQFLESRKFSVLDVARFLGVPPTKLFDITAATYSNVENSNLEVATDTLDAWVVNLEMEADVKILNNRYGGRFTEMDLYSVFRGDMKTRSDYFKSLMSVGAITPNQIRSREGLAPYTGGDEYYIATNNFTPASRVNDVIDAQIAKGSPAPEPETQDVTPPKNEIDEELGRAAIHYLNNGK
jgi:HK97 family phage portal protein